MTITPLLFLLTLTEPQHMIKTDAPPPIAYHTIRQQHEGEIILFPSYGGSSVYHEDCAIVAPLFHQEILSYEHFHDSEVHQVQEVSIPRKLEDIIQKLNDDGLSVVVCRPVRGYEVKRHAGRETK